MRLELRCFEILHKKVSKQRLREKERKRARERGIEQMFVIEIWEDPLKKEMTTHSSILSWSIPWTGGLTGCSPWGHRVGHDWATNTLMIERLENTKLKVAARFF